LKHQKIYTMWHSIISQETWMPINTLIPAADNSFGVTTSVKIWCIPSSSLLSYEKCVSDATQNDVCEWQAELSVTLPQWINTSLRKAQMKKQNSIHFCLPLYINWTPCTPTKHCSTVPIYFLSHIHKNIQLLHKWCNEIKQGKLQKTAKNYICSV